MVTNICHTKTDSNHQNYIALNTAASFQIHVIMRYNIIRGPSCIESSSFFTPNRYTTSRGHPYRLSVPLANIIVRNHFFSNRIISVWNSLPTELVQIYSSRIKRAAACRKRDNGLRRHSGAPPRSPLQ